MSHAITRAPTTSNTPVKAAVMARVVLCTPKIEKSIKDVLCIVDLIFGGLIYVTHQKYLPANNLHIIAQDIGRSNLRNAVQIYTIFIK
jgi:hypothetical protein